MKVSSISGPLGLHRPLALVLAAVLAAPLAGCAGGGPHIGHARPHTTPTVGNRIPILSRVEAGATEDKDIASVGVLTDIDADPIIDHGRVYALGQGGRMAAYELVTGQRIWELNLAGISTPAVAGDWIFTLTDEAKVLCIARSTGKVRWVAQLDRFHDGKSKKGALYWSGPVLAGDRLWLVNSEGGVYAVSAMDGTSKRFAKLGEKISLAPVVAGKYAGVLHPCTPILSALCAGSSLAQHCSAAGVKAAARQGAGPI